MTCLLGYGMNLDTVARAIAENDLLLQASAPYTAAGLFDLVHALRFRGWLCDNLGVRLPATVQARLEAIDTATFVSPGHGEPLTAVADLQAVTQSLHAAVHTALTIDWTVRRDYFKPNHRHLGDWVLFMTAHDAWHLGRAAARRTAQPAG